MKILALITDAETAHACLDAAAAASRAWPGALIEVVHAIVDPETLIVASEEIAIQRMREPEEGTPQERVDAAHTAFVAWNAGAPDWTPELRWRAIDKAEEECVRDEAKDAVLIVLARGKDMDTGDAFHAAIFEAKKPLLWVPGHWRAGERRGFEHIAIGVDEDSAERAAVDASAPLLRVAETVTAIRISEEDMPASEPAHEELRQDVDVVWHVVPRRNDVELGAQIAQEAEALGADLLVCGAYRHNRFIEWLLGGTTRHLLAATQLPVLVAH